MVSGTCRSAVSQLSSENGIGREVKWMGDLAGSVAGTCCCGKSKAAQDSSSAVTTMESARRPAKSLSDLMSCILFAEPLNFTLLAGSVSRALRGSVRTKQVPSNPYFIGQGVSGNLQFPNSGCRISFCYQCFAQHHIGQSILGLEFQRLLG